MKTTVRTRLIVGINSIPALVTVTADPGHDIKITGLTESAVRETRVRVLSALESCDVEYVGHHISVAVSHDAPPASSAGTDLAIGVAMLAALGEIPAESLEGWAFVGELSLSGAVRSTRGVIAHVLAASRTQSTGLRGIVIPASCAAEGILELNAGLDVRTASSLRDIQRDGVLGLPHASMTRADNASQAQNQVDMADLRCDAQTRRALEIAAAGGHNMLIVSPYGGQHLLARALLGILPPMTVNEAVESAIVHSVAGLLRERAPLSFDRPCRAPHHTASSVGILGGGSPLRPGECSLAHNGVLVLDELPEFARDTMESLSRAIEEEGVMFSRASITTVMPARFQFVATMASCGCGKHEQCSCSPERKARYVARIEPLAEHIGICVKVDARSVFSSSENVETSAVVRARVIAARARAEARGTVDRHGRHPAMTIADLAGSDVITAAHRAEAKTYSMAL